MWSSIDFSRWLRRIVEMLGEVSILDNSQRCRLNQPATSFHRSWNVNQNGGRYKNKRRIYILYIYIYIQRDQINWFNSFLSRSKNIFLRIVFSEKFPIFDTVRNYCCLHFFLAESCKRSSNFSYNSNRSNYRFI